MREGPGLASVTEQAWDNVSARAHFRLGLQLRGQGHEEAAPAQFKRAHEVEPSNWNYQRQAWNLDGIEQHGYENVVQAIREPGAPEFHRQVDIVNKW